MEKVIVGATRAGVTGLNGLVAERLKPHLLGMQDTLKSINQNITTNVR
jgi:hypothetical protein